MDTCLYHSDKVAFDQVQKDLLVTRWIPKQFVHRLAMAVCACRKVKGEVATWESLQTQCSYLQSLLESDTEDKIPKSMHKQLSDCINSIRSGFLEYSTCRMVTIVYNAQHSDLSLLRRENVSSNKMDKGPQANKKKLEGKQKLTAAQIECIKRKKKRKCVSNIVKLSMFPGNKTKLEQLLTDNLSDFSKKNKCFIDLPRDLNNRSFENNSNTTYIKLWSRDVVSFSDIKCKLQKAAESAQRDIDDLRNRRRAVKAHRRFVRNNYEDWENQESVDLGYIADKTGLVDDYERKFFKERKDNTRKPGTSALSGGHCLQCMKPYSGLGDTSQCTYHPGYLVQDGVWSCCAEYYILGKTDVDTHSDTGCTTVNQHLWRPHAKRAGGQKKETYLDRQYARSRHIKHRYDKHKK